MGSIQFIIADCSGAEMILIDDTLANRIAWMAQAKRANQKLATFSCGEEFFCCESLIARETPIYVDYFFDGKVGGVLIAERPVQSGFSNVFFATAYSNDKMTVPSGVRGVVNKGFPDRLTPQAER